MYHLHETAQLSVFGPSTKYSARNSKLCTFYCGRSWKFCSVKSEHTFRLGMLDNTHLQKHLELIFASLQKYKSLDQTSRKMILLDLQREDCAPDALTSIEDVVSRFCQVIEKSFCARKVYPNTLYSDNTRSQ